MDRIYRVRTGTGARYAVERAGDLFWLDGDPFERYDTGARITGQRTGERLTFLAPVVPGKIVAIGLNYKDHAAEVNKPLPAEPLMFIKPSTAVIGPEEPIRLPRGVGEVHYESELAVVIGRTASCVAAADAMRYVLGLTCLNDVTARELQRKDVQYTRAKGFDTFAPLGPCVAVGLDGSSLAIEGWVNGERKQRSNTNQLIFPIARLVEFVSHVMTLHAGDVISTGTPSGVGPLAAGDRVVVKIDGIGTLSNPVVDRDGGFVDRSGRG
jgi:2-keto-4-pentenoate hydratase/2-oxohepta-3-ene-1,7-dioic acid hydratase in catechol pathway